MSNQMVTLAEKEEQERQNKKTRAEAEREERNKWLVPFTALLVANIIFFSLDIRAFQAIYLLTNSYLLAFLTVLISGGLAMYWFDVLYPHSKRHNNDTQKTISMVSTVLAIALSGVLAFADYVVGTGNLFSPMWSLILWGSVIVLTVYQGIAIAWWWSIDNHIAAQAKIQKMHAENTDKQDDIESMRTKLKSLRGFLDEYNKLNVDYTPEAVRSVASLLGISLPDEEGKGQNRPQQQLRPMNANAQDVDTVRLNGDKSNPTPAERKNP